MQQTRRIEERGMLILLGLFAIFFLIALFTKKSSQPIGNTSWNCNYPHDKAMAAPSAPSPPGIFVVLIGSAYGLKRIRSTRKK